MQQPETPGHSSQTQRATGDDAREFSVTEPSSSSIALTAIREQTVDSRQKSGLETLLADSASDEGLWDKVVQELRQSEEGRNAEESVMKILQGPNYGKSGSVESIASDITNRLEQGIKGQQKNSTTHRYVEKTVSILNKFVAAGDVAVSFDPVHAALPWAVLRSVLVVRCPLIALRGRLDTR